MSDLPVKIVGRWYDESMKDTNQVKETSKTLQEGLLRSIDVLCKGNIKYDAFSLYLFKC